MHPARSLSAIAASLALASLIAWAGSHGGWRVGGVPLFALCGAIAFVLNWLAFIPAYAFQTERYYDLTGSLTYLLLVAVALTLGDGGEPRARLLAFLVCIWAARLGSFLFLRIQQDGSDGRFDRIKPNFYQFLMMWTIQGLWVFLTLSCALATMTSERGAPLGAVAFAGSAVWLLGITLEIVADRQKRAFRTVPGNRDRFITTGLWAWSRHPNYFGEILLWIGIAIVAVPALSGAQFATLISPVFVFVLLTRISGIPMLESRAKHRWGDEPAYREYKARTPVLFPRRPAST
jgi:steroid 5-alpha reductase family enzyme